MLDLEESAEATRQARCLKDLGHLISLVGREEAGVPLTPTHSQQARSLVALSRIRKRWVALRNLHLPRIDWEWIGWEHFHKEQELNAVTEVLFQHAAVAVTDAVERPGQ